MYVEGFHVRTTVQRPAKRPAESPSDERETLIASLIDFGETMHLRDLRVVTSSACQCAKDGGLHASTAEKHRRRRARPARPAELRVVQGPPMRVTEDHGDFGRHSSDCQPPVDGAENP